MKWSPAQCIGLSAIDCTYCRGMGTRLLTKRYGRNSYEAPCNCVFRGAFRACLSKYRQCQAEAGRIGIVRLERRNAQQKGAITVYGFNRAEYAADFDLVARRYLDPSDYEVFRLHFLLKLNWRQCCAALKIARGPCFHSIYRIEQTLGRAFAEIEPYGLWPINEYFGGVTVHTTPPRAMAAG